MNSYTRSTEHHAIPQPDAFDPSSGTLVERLLFNHRSIILGICVLLSLILGYQALSLKLNAAFEKMIPTDHPYVQNYLKNRGQLGEGGNTLRIAVEAKQGSIFDAAYLETVKKINDEVFLLPGVDRSYMKSLWTPATRWIGVTEEGFDGGPVIPDDYDGSAKSLDQVRQNVDRSGEVGRLVAANFKSSIVLLPLQDITSDDGKPLDYNALSGQLEQIRAKYETDNIKIHITGFAKVVGDLIDGMRQMQLFFAATLIICGIVLFWYTRCVRSTLLVLLCSIIAVVWLLCWR
jgi:predicted RND superfamily exporter protein